MIRALFLLSCLNLSFISSLQADTFPPGAKAEWIQYFQGDPIIPDPEVNLDRLITAPDPRCIDIKRTILSQTTQYGRKAFENKNSATKRQSKEILDLLHHLEDSGDICFDSAARTYLAATLHLLDPSNSNIGAEFNNARLDGHPFANGLELTLLGAAILNHRLANGEFAVQFLTPSRRIKTTMAPVWNQKTGSEFLVSAGYDCAKRTILIDPYLTPFNLGAIFVHELDHLFRDRVNSFGLLPLIEDQMTDHSLDQHLPLSIAMDETLASVVSAYYQRHMQWFHNFKPHDYLLFASENPLPFVLSNDLTLFRNDKKGPINEIWTLLEKTNNHALGPEINASAGYLLYQTFLRGDPFQPTRAVREPPLDQIQNIYQTIHKGYFNGESLSTDDLALLDPSLHGSSNDPLSRWLDAFRVATADDDQSIVNDQISWVREVPGKEYQSAIEHSHSIVRIAFNLDRLFKGLDLIFPQLFAPGDPSPYCSQYLKGLEDGTLASYVGNRLSTGFKPGETGVKSGETGVKPGETGVKSGETGVKPSIIRPCLNIGREL